MGFEEGLVQRRTIREYLESKKAHQTLRNSIRSEIERIVAVLDIGCWFHYGINESYITRSEVRGSVTDKELLSIATIPIVEFVDGGYFGIRSDDMFVYTYSDEVRTCVLPGAVHHLIDKFPDKELTQIMHTLSNWKVGDSLPVKA